MDSEYCTVKSVDRNIKSVYLYIDFLILTVLSKHFVIVNINSIFRATKPHSWTKFIHLIS